ncbi:type I restriction enzyme, S subunit [Evansella caseinilytica]|uniref:Type I restriction enzyme, S subunit n=1 Tax=Evansella caseinilytica TaxID=1503961 RepID=A0A1H3SVH1_9BACI|nr:restriction endonuclease subunit S [Evansella caseinilytica]SDZ41541.1 type I restriction enzyme, S subunit [Evansella caseinilytica]
MSKHTYTKYRETATIPMDWELRKISEIGHVVTGVTPKTGTAKYWNGDIPFVSPADMNEAKYIGKTARYVTPAGAAHGRIVPENSLMVTCIASIGKMAVSTEKCITNQQINTIIPGGNYDTDFLYYALKQKVKLLVALAGKTSVPIINKKSFSDIYLKIPPLQEQRYIASILSSVDEAAAKTKQIIGQTERMKTGLLQELLTKGTGHFSFKNTDIGVIPETWTVTSLKEISSKITKGTTPSTYGYCYEREGVNFIKVENITKQGIIQQHQLVKISAAAHEKLSRSNMQKGDIVVTIAGALGRTAIIPDELLPVNTNQAVAIVRINHPDCNNEYIHYALQSSMIKKHIAMVSTVGAQPNLSLKQVGDFTLPLPPLHEQRQIAAVLASMDKKLLQEEKKLSALLAVKKGLMQSLLSGKIPARAIIASH